MFRQALAGVAILFGVLPAGKAAGQYTRVSEDKVITLTSGVGDAVLHRPAAGAGGRAIDLVFEATPRAWHGQPAPGGGTLDCKAHSDPATINAAGRMAFHSKISGSQRNQGIFVADETGLRAVVVGCGGGGGSGVPGSGCGDPAPVGGTFCGLFGGTSLAPGINDAGDVLFLADVDGGAAPRGLFLYRAAEDDIVTVAAVGEPAPIGGTISAIGPGSMNNLREILFLARCAGSDHTHIFLWADRVVSKYVAVGDPVPGGGVFKILAGEAGGFKDGTWIPTGALPDIRDDGLIAFFGIVTGGLAERGVFLSRDGVHEWHLRRGEPTPLGGTYDHFWAPILNDSGQMAVYAELTLPGGDPLAAWIVGRPGQWRKALAFYDQIDGGEVFIQPVSRNPFTPLDECGNLMVSCAIRLPGGAERELSLMLSADGGVDVLARQGDPTPLGGSYGTIQSWPSMNNDGMCTLSAGTPGATVQNAHFVATVGNLPGDADDDGDLDLDDHAELHAVLAGPTACPPSFAARVFDFDGDADVDLADAGAFQEAFTGR